jgi:spermidine synthase
MRKPIGKKALSFIKDVLLESTSSMYNEVLDIYLSMGRYQLRTSGAIYSYEDKYINFFNTFDKLKWQKTKIRRVLVLGLGLGSVPQMLEQKFNKDFEYHLVEIDPEIIYLAEKYVLHDLNSPVQVFEIDAELFVNISEELYDMIIIDIFEDDVVPLKFESKEFLKKTAKLLSSDGVLLYNRLNIDNETKSHTLKYFDYVFKTIFPLSNALYIKDNIILCNREDVFL